MDSGMSCQKGMPFLGRIRVSLFLWFLWFFVGFFLLGLSPAISLLWLLFFPALEDMKTGMVWDGWSAGVFLVGGWQAFLSGEFLLHLWSLCGVVLFFGLLFLFFPHSLGLGDVIFASALSVWFLPSAAAFFVWLSFMLAAVYGISLFLWKRQEGNRRIPFVPFLSLGGFLSYVCWDSWWFEEALRIYFG